jgi:hypothetical protein
MAGRGFFNLPRDPTTDPRIKRAARKIAGARDALLYIRPVGTDDKGRLKIFLLAAGGLQLSGSEESGSLSIKLKSGTVLVLSADGLDLTIGTGLQNSPAGTLSLKAAAAAEIGGVLKGSAVADANGSVSLGGGGTVGTGVDTASAASVNAAVAALESDDAALAAGLSSVAGTLNTLIARLETIGVLSS